MGFERGNTISRAWDEAATYGALDVATHLASRLDSLAGGRIAGRPDAKKRLRDGCRRLAERAFRRPLTDEQRRFFVDRHFEGKADLESAVKKAVLLILKSPRFLYLEAGSGPPDAYDVASRISFGLWDTLPDRKLLEAAKAGKLNSRADIARQVERMVSDPRTRTKVREFYHQWLGPFRKIAMLIKHSVVRQYLFEIPP